MIMLPSSGLPAPTTGSPFWNDPSRASVSALNALYEAAKRRNALTLCLLSGSWTVCGSYEDARRRKVLRRYHAQTRDDLAVSDDLPPADMEPTGLKTSG